MVFIVYVWVLATAMLAFAQDATFEQELATVEQYYIPALFVSGHGPKEKAPAAFQRFQQQWQQFTRKYHQTLQQDPWAGAVQQINNHLQQAATLLQEGKVFEAHRQLEPVRNILADVRHQLGNPTLMDALTEFHDHMEVIMKTVRQKSPEALSTTDIEKIKTHATAALRAWQKVKIGPREKAIYQLSDDQVAFLQRNIQVQQQTLNALKSALAQKNAADILKYARGIRSGFITVFRALGKTIE